MRAYTVLTSAGFNRLLYTKWNSDQENTPIGGTSDVVLLGHVPEPSSMLLLGTGVLGLAGMLRRKINL